MKANDCFNLEKKAIPYWYEYYKTIFKIERLIDVRDKNKGYDIEIITNYGNTFKIDEKTRNGNYFNLFKNDNKILIETCGNIEKEKKGSSIFTSIADYWAYGWLNQNKIVNPIIFRREPIKNYIDKNKNNFEIKISNTDEIYHTENVLVDYEIIKKYQINNCNKKLMFWM